MLVIPHQTSRFWGSYEYLLLQNTPWSIPTRGVPHKYFPPFCFITNGPKRTPHEKQRAAQTTCQTSLPGQEQHVNRIIRERVSPRYTSHQLEILKLHGRQLCLSLSPSPFTHYENSTTQPTVYLCFLRIRVSACLPHIMLSGDHQICPILYNS